MSGLTIGIYIWRAKTKGFETVQVACIREYIY